MYRESVNWVSGIVVSTVENELVKVNSEAFELDRPFEVEEPVDSVPVLDVSVVCCASATSATRNCSHISCLLIVAKCNGSQEGYVPTDMIATNGKKNLWVDRRQNIDHLFDIRSLCTYAQVSSHGTAIPGSDLARFSHSQ